MGFHHTAANLIRNMGIEGNAGDAKVREAMIALFNGNVSTAMPGYNQSQDRVLVPGASGWLSQILPIGSAGIPMVLPQPPATELSSWSRFSDRILYRLTSTKDRFLDGWSQLGDPAASGNRFVDGAGEFSRRAKTHAKFVRWLTCSVIWPP